ncbi:MAG TPA: type II toxin-antitoxin system RelE/ParE family toxin [Polyangia bacterium]|jgi:plasmid stabilization system protein ParE|nr:type II toxin-antitoxin system RelE/ParE family toxin [Polyangia bacterium]
MRRLVLRPEARAEIEEAALWYEEQRLGLSDGYISELEAVLHRVREAPLHFPEVESHVRRAPLHRFPYAVYFLLEEQAVVVVAVLHVRRNPEVWKRRV